MKTKSILMALAMALGIATGASAQESSPNENGTSVVVATVGITDAKVVSQKENTLNIAFNITNRTGAQPGLKYAVTLLKQDGQEMKVFDQRIYDETLSVGADETVHKEITYVAPGSLRGKYIPTIEVRNSEGFMFQTASLEEVTLQGSAQSVYIASDSCKLILSSESEKMHGIEEALNVKKDETLKIRCDIESTFQNQKQMIPEFSVYYRSLFGKRMINEKGVQIVVGPNQKSTIELDLPKAGEPQLYAATIRLLGQTNNETSNTVQLLYNVPGESAAIQNVQLDKDSYQSGETAKVTVFFLGGDGNGGVKGTIDGGELVIDIKDGQGNACAQTSFEKQKTDLKSEYEIAITKACTDPTVSVSVKGKDGKELAKNIFKVETKSDQQQNIQETLKKSENTKKAAYVLGVILAAICIISIIFILYKKRKSGIKIFILGIVAVGSLVLADQSKGETGTRYAPSQTINAYNMQGYLYATYRGNFNKATYNEGETITVTSSGTFYLNAADKFTIDVYDRILTSGGSNIYTVTRSGLNGTTVNYPTFNITAPTCAGCGHDHDKRSNFGKSTKLGNGRTHVGGHFAGSVMTNIDCSNSGVPRQGECAYLGSISYGNGVSIGFDVPNPIDLKCGTANSKTYQSVMPGGRYNSANDCVWLRLTNKDGNPYIPYTTLCEPGFTDFPSCSAVTESAGKINWTCNGQDGGSNANCSATVTPAPYCGDKTCNNGETCTTCPGDCGVCPVTPACGDNVCSSSETCTTCPGDCGMCQTGFVCTGLAPDNNATLVPGDNIGLTVNTARTLVSANTVAKCEYTCNPGYNLVGGKCVAACSATPIYSCSYNPPLNEDICKDKNELVTVEATCNCDGCTGVCPAKTTLGDCNSNGQKCSPKVINCTNTGNRKLPGGYQEIVP
jgi:hypothetical protein